ncbi:MAG: hypothetical protein P8182_05060 [Deltaproteobacteria bacterium]
MAVKRAIAVICAAFLMSVLLPPVYSQNKKPSLDKDGAKLVGRWEIVQTKAPGKPYQDGYKGRPFVTRGPNSFILILEYNSDGTFRRISRVNGTETVQKGNWSYSGHELRHKRKSSPLEEIMYVRFTDPDRFTSIEVHEETPDPGLFARFRRIK